MAGKLDIFLTDRQGKPRGDAQLFTDDVDAGHHFGHRVLDLYPGVHLDEEELAVLVEELEGAGTTVADLEAGIPAGLEDLFARLLVQAGGRGFLENLLMATLQGAVPVIEMNGITLPSASTCTSTCRGFSRNFSM